MTLLLLLRSAPVNTPSPPPPPPPPPGGDTRRIFRPPTVKLRPADPQGERLWLYFGIDVGISVLKNQDGTYTQTQYPTTDEIDAAAVAYIGGHEYEVDDAEFFSLVAAGYLSSFDDLSGTAYGDGAYGSNPFGT